MPADWPFATSAICLAGADRPRIQADDAARQTLTAEHVLQSFRERPGILLSDEVGMGKTYVALAVAASVILTTKGKQGPVVVMVPGRLHRKWQREWEQFKRHCVLAGNLNRVRAADAHTPTEFFKLLDDPPRQRSHLVFLTTGCFSRGLSDPWIRLAMIRLARQKTRLTTLQKRRLYRWTPHLIRQTTKLPKEVVRKLLNRNVEDWKRILIHEGLLDEDADDPVPELLSRFRDDVQWDQLVKIIRKKLPQKTSQNIGARIKRLRAEFNQACEQIYEQWLRCAKWSSPLLILDEAHHAKNDHTRLARLFRQSSENDVTLLNDKFHRMLFLTATPFQLGHQELIRVIRSFDAIRWTGPLAPTRSREETVAEIEELNQALDANRLAGRRLDRLWGGIRSEDLGEKTPEDWWRQLEASPENEWQQRLLQNVNDCHQTRDSAQRLLRHWVIRHNRPRHLPAPAGQPSRLRRTGVYGRAIVEPDDTANGAEHGLPVTTDAALPFLLTARAQGELAEVSGARAFFAEGLASSYEAFHHTRTARGEARDMNDDGTPLDESPDDDSDVSTIVPTAWYEERIAEIIPSRDAAREERLQHPKVGATVRRVVDLWEGGEKVLVFCFYRETCRALYDHIKEEINARTLQIAGDKLGAPHRDDPEQTQEFLARIARRFSEEGRPFYREVRSILSEPFADAEYKILLPFQTQLIEVLAAYFRAPSFLARYLPLDDPAVQNAFEPREGRREVLEPGLQALRRGILEQTDQSDQTYLQRVRQFLDFAIELAERSETRVDLSPGEEDDEAENPLKECLDAVSVYSQPRRPEEQDSDETVTERPEDDGSYRVVPLVRNVHGETRQETRERLALAFNSPLFPEILVSSGVMGEGIDLHRFCRHVIHHDGYWNPSTLEQQTGRVDRIRCKAEACHMPIRVYQPFIAGSADEKMFRVVRDRERWFQVVMGQKFEFDEGASEELASRVPLPENLASQLTFNLARWQA
ncbi:MAG: hypothetical protein DWQ34_06765 [Planctomycetota bacterium]|nr:MAG: hypothetical protein DWQ34_06765 [Planctomycetota bacterium]REK25069.1 MAG: hypothetical protein DWQ41_12915 [Planctomycetota bacterium]REK28134.1 MAG: hypothetical protein DWQ45_25240 [Planctomycetota bacterium]